MSTEVLLADGHPLTRLGLRKMLEDTGDLHVCGEAGHGLALLDAIRERDWGLVVLDVSIPGRSGLELIKLARAERPRLPILIFTSLADPQYAVRAIRAGALGFLSKEAGVDLLLHAMRRVAQGRVYVSPEVTELLVTDVSRNGDAPPHTLLSDREYSIFHRIVRGDKLTDIADELSLSIKTVSTHKSHILDKMTLGGQVELVRYAIEHKLLDSARE